LGLILPSFHAPHDCVVVLFNARTDYVNLLQVLLGGAHCLLPLDWRLLNLLLLLRRLSLWLSLWLLLRRFFLLLGHTLLEICKFCLNQLQTFDQSFEMRGFYSQLSLALVKQLHALLTELLDVGDVLLWGDEAASHRVLDVRLAKFE